jgi:hypothetical protein
MKKLVAVAAIAALFPAVALAQQNNIGSCGWGSKLFDGQRRGALELEDRDVHRRQQGAPGARRVGRQRRDA